MRGEVMFSIRLLLFTVCSTCIMGDEQLVKDAISSMQESLITSIRLLQDQVDQRSRSTIEKIVSRLEVLEDEMRGVSKAVLRMEERAHVLDAFQLHISAWSDLMSSVDSKIDHLDRSQREHFRSEHEQLGRLHQLAVDKASDEHDFSEASLLFMKNTSEQLEKQKDLLFSLQRQTNFLKEELMPTDSTNKTFSPRPVSMAVSSLRRVSVQQTSMEQRLTSLLEELKTREEDFFNLSQTILDGHSHQLTLNSRSLQTNLQCCTQTRSQLDRLQQSLSKVVRDDDQASTWTESSNASETCATLMARNVVESGVYTVTTANHVDNVFNNQLLCDQVTQGGGWTVIMQRAGSSSSSTQVNFTRSWQEYREGFGSLETEFYLGNDNIHSLTDQLPQVLRVDLEDHDGHKAHAIYQGFRLGSEMSNFRLIVGAFVSGEAGDALAEHNNTSFSTFDKNNEPTPSCCPCANIYASGSWFHKGCFDANLNGLPLDETTLVGGIVWSTWRGHQGLRAARMMIRDEHPKFT